MGHKQQLLPFIMTTIAMDVGDAYDVADIFSGTGAVSAEFKKHGYRVIANDHLYWCFTLTEAILLNNEEPTFREIISEIGQYHSRTLLHTPYDEVLAYLNTLEPVEGFIYHNYSPALEMHDGNGRMYFTPENAGRIDSVRGKIMEWESLLTRGERALLLADLIRAANAVSNVAGTYGCYLKHWKSRALEQLLLKRSKLVFGSARDHRVFCEDANKLASEIASTIVYADPPYTKRQYAAYYHVLETIALRDNPKIQGSTGLRQWQTKSSDYCYRAKAPSVLENLVAKLNCRHFFLSYSEDGQIPHETIVGILSKYGQMKVYEAPYRRYKSSSLPHKDGLVMERLYHLSRA